MSPWCSQARFVGVVSDLLTRQMFGCWLVVYPGCGVFDGSEITEATATLVHLSRADASFQCFAPDVPQMHALDHTKGEELDESRNTLVESARIARGDVNVR